MLGLLGSVWIRLYRFGHYFTATGPFTLAQCISKLEWPLFLFRQISHFFKSICPAGQEAPTLSPEKWRSTDKRQRGGISLIYGLLLVSPDKLSWRTGTGTCPLIQLWKHGTPAFQGSVNIFLY